MINSILTINLCFVSKMKILHVYKSASPESTGGIEQFIQSLCLESHKNHIQADILTTSNHHSRQVSHNHSKIFFFRHTVNFASCPISLDFLKNFHKIIKQYDLIHYHHPWPFIDLLHILYKVKIPAIVTYHADIVRQKTLFQIYKPLQAKFLSQMQTIVTTSKNIQSSSPILRKYLNKIAYIPINISQDLYPKPNHELNHRWQKRLGPKFFLFIGVLRYYKGLHILLEALSDTHLPMVIAGTGPQEAKLKKYAKELKLDHVIFLGQVSEEDKICLLSTCYALVCPSHLRAEAFGINILEGLMFSKPLISTELGTGTSFVNRHNVSGLVINPGRTDLLRDAMLKLYHDTSLYQKLCQGSALHYQQSFQKPMIEKYLNIYRTTLERDQNALIK